MEDEKKCILGASSKAAEDGGNVSGRKRFILERKGKGMRLVKGEGPRLLRVM